MPSRSLLRSAFRFGLRHSRSVGRFLGDRVFNYVALYESTVADHARLIGLASAPVLLVGGVVELCLQGVLAKVLGALALVLVVPVVVIEKPWLCGLLAWFGKHFFYRAALYTLGGTPLVLTWGTLPGSLMLITVAGLYALAEVRHITYNVQSRRYTRVIFPLAVRSRSSDLEMPEAEGGNLAEGGTLEDHQGESEDDGNDEAEGEEEDEEKTTTESYSESGSVHSGSESEEASDSESESEEYSSAQEDESDDSEPEEVGGLDAPLPPPQDSSEDSSSDSSSDEGESSSAEGESDPGGKTD
eukprot:TRINITY_DN4796_c0_g1_i4.p1 TRINITY_DN4796_c0_g1~~TRINITY_DN4796_c0_g1_i4.p1  ORF type:complete len:300 (-),score=87.69 TRINITY_DN4796_c0_g1_i4:77-976(-)